jgi:uncharacterized protein YggE
MKTYIRWIGLLLAAILALGAALFRPEPGHAESPAPAQRTLEVTGQGSLRVKPDTAVITLGVTQLKENPTQAYSAMNEVMARVVAALKAKGVTDDQLKTGMLYLDAQYDWTKEGGQVLKGYRATNTVTVTTQALDKVGVLIQAAMEAGANQLQGVSFQVKDSEALMAQALDLAADDAKAKAERVARRLGVSVVGVYKIDIMDNGRVFYANEAAAKAGAAPVFPGTTDFTVTVRVTFEIR